MVWAEGKNDVILYDFDRTFTCTLLLDSTSFTRKNFLISVLVPVAFGIDQYLWNE